MLSERIADLAYRVPFLGSILGGGTKKSRIEIGGRFVSRTANLELEAPLLVMSGSPGSSASSAVRYMARSGIKQNAIVFYFNFDGTSLSAIELYSAAVEANRSGVCYANPCYGKRDVEIKEVLIRKGVLHKNYSHNEKTLGNGATGLIQDLNLLISELEAKNHDEADSIIVTINDFPGDISSDELSTVSACFQALKNFGVKVRLLTRSISVEHEEKLRSIGFYHAIMSNEEGELNLSSLKKHWKSQRSWVLSNIQSRKIPKYISDPFNCMLPLVDIDCGMAYIKNPNGDTWGPFIVHFEDIKTTQTNRFANEVLEEESIERQ